MVRAFLSAELHSPRFSPALKRHIRQLGLTPRSVLAPATSARTRWSLLRRHRPGMMKSLPTDCRWYLATLELNDWSRVRYMNHPDWKRLSGPTRRVDQAARHLRSRGEHDRLRHRVEEMIVEMKHGQRYEPIILVTNVHRRRFVILEGHARVTAYATRQVKHEGGVIIGVTQKIHRWIWW